MAKWTVSAWTEHFEHPIFPTNRVQCDVEHLEFETYEEAVAGFIDQAKRLPETESWLCDEHGQIYWERHPKK